MADDITGRDALIIGQALVFAAEAWARMPDEHRPDSDIADLKEIISARMGDEPTLAFFQEQARRRLTALFNR